MKIPQDYKKGIFLIENSIISLNIEKMLLWYERETMCAYWPVKMSLVSLQLSGYEQP